MPVYRGSGFALIEDPHRTGHSTDAGQLKSPANSSSGGSYNDHTIDGDRPGPSLIEIANCVEDRERLVFGECHAFGAVSGAYMLRIGCFKLIEYVGFELSYSTLPGTRRDRQCGQQSEFSTYPRGIEK